jgi:hypothetical protein
MSQDATKSGNAVPQNAPRKRPYVPPRLVSYGDVASLTQNGNGSGLDGGPPGMAMVM